MERKKWWAGLIAVAVGLAFSVGSASAYEQGDFAEGFETNSGKLVPYYMAGDNLATIIGVNNHATATADGATALAAGTVSIIEVRVLNATGAVQAVGELCLAPNQFGYAVLKEEMMMDDTGDMMDPQVVLMVGVGDATAKVYGMMSEATTGVSGRAGSSVNMTSTGMGISSMGYVVLSELGTFTMENPDSPADPPVNTDEGCDSQGDPLVGTDGDAGSVGARFAAWTILQDVGEGSFFGTEIPTLTVDTGEALPVAPATGDMDRIDSTSCGTAANCRGLIGTTADTTDTMVTARFDNSMMNMSESMVYVWMDTSTAFNETTGMRAPREVVSMVYCEGSATANRVVLNLPDRINMIDGMDLGCDGRGVVMITLPDSGTAGTEPSVAAVWSHVSQMGGGFRMSFTGFEDL